MITHTINAQMVRTSSQEDTSERYRLVYLSVTSYQDVPLALLEELEIRVPDGIPEDRETRSVGLLEPSNFCRHHQGLPSGGCKKCNTPNRQTDSQTLLTLEWPWLVLFRTRKY